jgi:glycine/D-amino acid oxidase-like deaminating enzyme
MKIIIVGAGAFGAWAAYHARLRGAEVALVDSWGAGNTRASSGGESRVIRAIYGPDELYTRLTAESLQQWRAFDQRWGHACFLPCGALWLLGEGGEAGYIEEALPHMAVHDLPVERMEMKELRRRYPAIGTQGLRAAYLEREAGMLHAREACRRVVEA